MAQYVVFDKSVEVSGSMVCSLLNATSGYEKDVLTILTKNNIEDPLPEKWYNMQDYLNAVKEISRLYGPSMLFSIGKFIPQHIHFTSSFNNLEIALRSLDNMHQSNHRGGDIGYYKLISFNSEKKEAKVECKNPYPCYLDRGILTTLCREFKPDGSNLVYIELDMNRPNRLAGAHVSYYTIIWD